MSEASTYQLLPDLPADDYQRLKDDIAARGLMVPIEVDEHGQILDGHHRKKACDELGVPIRTVVRSGLLEHEKRLHAVALNMNRRHLTDAQKALIGESIEPDIAERARLRQLKLAGRRIGSDLVDNCPQGQAKSRDEVAAQVGLGAGRTYDRHKKVLERARNVAPELLDRAAAGDVSMRDLSKEVRTLERRAKADDIAATPVPELTTLTEFDLIYVDPPWRYEHVETADRAIENHYPTMSADELKSLEVPAARDCVMFMWATSPKLYEALELMVAWGFDYRTCMVWVKDKIGMGYYARQQHELLLIGRKGTMPVPDPENRPSSVVNAPRTAHSAKPHQFYELLERMYPGRTKVELFARNARDGWAAWGNQA